MEMNDNKFDFNDVFNTFQTKILRYLTRLVGRNEAEDLTQEVFVKVSKGLKDFKGKSSFSTWIYRIATNVALDRKRSTSFQKESSKDSITLDELTEMGRDVLTVEKKPSIDQRAIKKEMNECIRDFIDNLPDNYRTVILLSELEGFKNQEIAEIIGISLDTVKIRLHRARVKLKEELESGCDFYHSEESELACNRKSGKNKK